MPIYLLFSFCSHRKDPWRLSGPRKQRLRERLRAVDDVIATIARSGVQCRALEQAQALPTEAEMSPRDKYTVFNRNARGLRKSVHKVSRGKEGTVNGIARGALRLVVTRLLSYRFPNGLASRSVLIRVDSSL